MGKNGVIYKVGVDASEAIKGAKSMKQVMLSLAGKKQKIQVELDNATKVRGELKELYDLTNRIGGIKRSNNVSKFIGDLESHTKEAKTQLDGLQERYSALTRKMQLKLPPLVDEGSLKKLSEMRSEQDYLSRSLKDYEVAQKNANDAFNAFSAHPTKDNFKDYEKSLETFKKAGSELPDGFSSIEEVKSRLKELGVGINKVAADSYAQLGKATSDFENFVSNIAGIGKSEGLDFSGFIGSFETLGKKFRDLKEEWSSGGLPFDEFVNRLASLGDEVKKESEGLTREMQKSAKEQYEVSRSDLTKEYTASLAAAEKLKNSISGFSKLAGVEEQNLTFGDLKRVAEEADRSVRGLGKSLDNLEKQSSEKIKEIVSGFREWGSEGETVKQLKKEVNSLDTEISKLNQKAEDLTVGDIDETAAEQLLSIEEERNEKLEKRESILKRIQEIEASMASKKEADQGSEGADEVSDASSGSLSGLDTSVSEEASKLASRLGSIKDKIGGFVSATKDHLKSFKSDVASNWGKAINGVIGLGKAITKNLGQKAISTLKPFGNALAGVSKSLLGISAFQSVGNAIGGLFNRIAKLASLAFVFRVITQGFRAIKKDITEAFGTYLNYDSSLNSSINTLKMQFSTLKAQLASAFSPIISLIVPALSTFVGWAVSAANAMSALIASLTGRTSWKKAVVNSVGAVGDAASGAADDLGDAADKAEELKEKLGNYDKLNVIGDDNKTKSSGSGSKGSGGSGGAGKGADISYVDQTIGEGIKNLAGWLKDMWEKADFTELGALVGQKLKDALDNIPWADIKQKAYNVGSSIATFLNGFFRTPGLGTTLGNTIAEFINTGLSAAYGFVHNFDFSAFGQFIVDGINAAIMKLDFSLAAATLKEGIDGIFTVIKTATDPIFGIQFGTLGAKIAGFIQDVTNLDWATAEAGFRGLGRGIADFANNLITPETLGSLGSAVAGCVNTISGALGSFIQRADWEQYGLSLATFFNDLVTKVNWEQVGADFGGAIHGLITTIKEFFSNLSFSDIVTAVTDFFKGAFSELDFSDVAFIIAAALGAAIVSTIVKDIGVLLAMNGGVGGIIVSALGAAISAAAPILLPVAIVGAIAVGLALAINGLSSLDWKSIGEGIVNFVKDAIGVIALALDFVVNLMENIENIPIIGWIFKVINAPLKFSLELTEHILKGDVIEWLKSKWEGAKNFAVNVSSKIVDAGKSAIGWIQDRFTDAKNWVANISAKITDALTESPVFKWLYEKFQSAKNWVANISAKIADFLEDCPVFKWLYEKFQSASEWVANMKANIADGIDAAFKGFLEWIKGIADGVVSFGISFLDNIDQGIKDLLNWIKGIADNVVSFTVSVLGDIGESVSWLFTQIKDIFSWGKKTTYEIEIEAQAEQAKQMVQELFDTELAKLSDVNTSAQNLVGSINGITEARQNSIQANTDEAVAAGFLADKYFDLAEKENRTAEENALMHYYAEQLVKTYPELNGLYDEQTGLISATRDEVDKLIKSRKNEAILNELISEYGKLGAALEKQKIVSAEATTNWNNYKAELKEAGISDEQIAKFEALNTKLAENGKLSDEDQKEYDKLLKKFGKTSEIENYKDLIEQAGQANANAAKATSDLETELTEQDTAITNYSSKVADGAKETENLTNRVNELKETGGAEIEYTATDSATPVVEGVKTEQGTVPTTVNTEYTATDSATPVAEGVKTEQGTVPSTVNTEYTATDSATPVAEGVKTEQGTVPSTVNTSYTATDDTAGVPDEVKSSTDQVPDEKTITFKADTENADSGISNVGQQVQQLVTEKTIYIYEDGTRFEEENTKLVEGINSVPNEKTVTFSDVGGLALSILAATIFGMVVNSIPNEKTITFSVENNTEEPIKTIKEALTGVKTHVVDTVSPAIESSIKTTFEASAKDAKDYLLGADSVHSAMTALKGHITTILGGLKRTFSTDFSEIHSAVKKELLQNTGIEDDFNTLRSSAKDIVERLKSDVVTLFSDMRREAKDQIQEIQDAIDSMRGTTLKVVVTDNGTVERVEGLIRSIPTEHRVNVIVDWSGDLYKQLSVSVDWDTFFRAIGGILRGNKWEDLPNVAHYAGGTARAHGTVFVAGENGAEAVGNINGHTEVLNKSQLAAAMYGSVLAAVARSGSSIAEYIVQNIVSCTNVLVSAISSVPRIVQTLGGNLLNMVNEALSSGSEEKPEQTNLLREMISINRESSSRVTELIEAQKEISPILSRVLDFLSMSFEAQRQAHVESAQLSNALQALALAGNGERLIDLIINLDGRVIYEDMVQIDRGTQRITGRSGFAT